MNRWTDVCEDAATFKQKSGTSYVNGGGARNADDKVLQHNGGGTVAVKNFYVTNVGKVYRSCGNCGTQYARKSTFDNVKVSGAGVVAGVNGNLGGKAEMRRRAGRDADKGQTRRRSKTAVFSTGPAKYAGCTRESRAASRARLRRLRMER